MTRDVVGAWKIIELGLGAAGSVTQCSSTSKG